MNMIRNSNCKLAVTLTSRALEKSLEVDGYAYGGGSGGGVGGGGAGETLLNILLPVCESFTIYSLFHHKNMPM